MVFSAFKSTSRRGTASTNSSKEERIPNRRSRSVSAVSRTVDGSVPSNSSVSDEFLNMRDNPLYCYSSSSSSSALLPGAEASAADSNARRGRPVSRGLGAGSQSPGIDRSGMNARSLSRVDTGGRRLRSVSREHHENLEADMELRFKSTASLRCKEDGMTATDVKEETRSLHKWTGRHPVSESWDASGCAYHDSRRHLLLALFPTDRTSTSSFSALERDTSPVDVGSDLVQFMRLFVLKFVVLLDLVQFMRLFVLKFAVLLLRFELTLRGSWMAIPNVHVAWLGRI